MKDIKGDPYVVIEGETTWLHGLNPMKKQPKSIVIRIKSRGKEIIACEVTKEDGWHWRFHLPRYDKRGKEIPYILEEDPIADYQFQRYQHGTIGIHRSVELNDKGEPTGRLLSAALPFWGSPADREHQIAAVLIGGIRGIWFESKKDI